MPHKHYEKLNNIEDAVGCTIDDTLLVVCVYKAPENSPYRWPISKWENLVKACRNSNIPKLVITSDVNMVNMPKTNWESFISENQYETEGLQALEKLHVSQKIRISMFDQATEDVLLCNDDFVRANYDAILNAKYSIDGRAASDHQAIQVEIHFEHHAAHRPSIMQYSFCKADYDELDRSIATDPFKGICWSNPDVLLSQWQNWLDEKLKATVPARTKHRKSLPPWVSQEGSRLLKPLQFLQRTGNSDKKSD